MASRNMFNIDSNNDLMADGAKSFTKPVLIDLGPLLPTWINFIPSMDIVITSIIHAQY